MGRGVFSVLGCADEGAFDLTGGRARREARFHPAWQAHAERAHRVRQRPLPRRASPSRAPRPSLGHASKPGCGASTTTGASARCALLPDAEVLRDLVRSQVPPSAGAVVRANGALGSEGQRFERGGRRRRSYHGPWYGRGPWSSCCPLAAPPRPMSSGNATPRARAGRRGRRTFATSR